MQDYCCDIFNWRGKVLKLISVEHFFYLSVVDNKLSLQYLLHSPITAHHWICNQTYTPITNMPLHFVRYALEYELEILKRSKMSDHK